MLILGLMSGTSLDGLDLALCDISQHRYRVLAAATYAYPEMWRRRLVNLEGGSALDLARTHSDLGHYFGQCVCRFLQEKPRPQYIASHGHTIFHQPVKPMATEDGIPSYGFTTQIGDINAIAAETGIATIGDFRTLDVALGGQGAPLVPIGDELFFADYDACLNLGGFANISYRKSEGGGRKSRIAYDICPCNMALNGLAAMLGLDYDEGGDVARGGCLDADLLARLDAIGYYRQPAPKSLGKEWFLTDFRPILDSSALSVADKLRTVTDHIARQVAAACGQAAMMLVTGGGAFNTFLIEQIRHYAPHTRVTVPDPLIVSYKEALIFALLGYLRVEGSENSLSSVTGARCDSIGGCISGSFKVL